MAIGQPCRSGSRLAGWQDWGFRRQGLLVHGGSDGAWFYPVRLRHAIQVQRCRSSSHPKSALPRPQLADLRSWAEAARRSDTLDR